ncbi:Complement C1q-like protein 4 C1q and tumor necrosis factor-related protein 11 [Collichthys lucidus]|uniref:Complement C1q-like protein 4 C1q and tumor necrosis factor-related protein 11 n=1 Tax=Collichthys lucidus TaxID=240159 RepID=A0A4U5U430_COLLU|nr:Complement C1q-like protein 4 C1q and tumor necrosis factor-related protein 11 [Collichthys lucidus]
MRVIACSLFILGLLWDNGRAENTISSLRLAAVAWEGELPCRKWDCECAFKQRGCCCAAPEVQEVEDQIFKRVMDLSKQVSKLSDGILEVIGRIRVAFTASMSRRTNCFGPFNWDSPIPYDVITLNHGNGYNPALGKLGKEGERMYYKVQLMNNGEVVASTWEDNREDSEDSSFQSVLLPLQQGDQVYVELMEGRHICGITEGLNTFSGSLIYSTME